MTREGESERGSTGFVFTRRRLLQTGAAGAAVAVAGCGHDEEESSPTGTGTGTETATPTPEPDQEQVERTGLVDEGLTVVKSELVDDPRRVQLQSELDQDVTTARYIRVVVRNDLDEPISAVTLSVDLFDDQERFLEVQLATVSGLRSGELFEGYVPFYNPNASLYIIRARRSERRNPPQPLSEISLTDHCLGDKRVHGTVTNDGDATVERLHVQVGLLTDGGNRLGTVESEVSDLGSAESRGFEVSFEPLLDGTTANVADYEIEVGDHGPGTMEVR